MKMPSGPLTLVALAAIAIGLILIFRLVTQSPTTPERKYTLKINGNPLPVKSVDDFKILLEGMVDGNRKMVHIVYDPITGLPPQDGPPFERVKTSQVTESQNSETGGDKMTGVNVTQRVTTDNEKAFQDVLDSFGSPTPSAATPTPTP
jgi:hypothetical protein